MQNKAKSPESFLCLTQAGKQKSDFWILEKCINSHPSVFLHCKIEKIPLGHKALLNNDLNKYET